MVNIRIVGSFLAIAFIIVLSLFGMFIFSFMIGSTVSVGADLDEVDGGVIENNSIQINNDTQQGIRNYANSMPTALVSVGIAISLILFLFLYLIFRRIFPKTEGEAVSKDPVSKDLGL